MIPMPPLRDQPALAQMKCPECEEPLMLIPMAAEMAAEGYCCSKGCDYKVSEVTVELVKLTSLINELLSCLLSATACIEIGKNQKIPLGEIQKVKSQVTTMIAKARKLGRS